MKNFQFSIFNFQKKRGYTLIELIIAVGLFALIMLLASGAYLLMISLNRQAQGIATGIDNLSFAVETMTRAIRTGTAYDCGGSGDCSNGRDTFSFKDASGTTISYDLSSSAIRETVGGTARMLTDPSVIISSLTFYAVGTRKPPSNYQQSYVTITISGNVSPPGKTAQFFTIETGATMRGSDL